MKNKPLILLLCIALNIPVINAIAQRKTFKPKPDLIKIINKNLKDADKQYQFLIAHTPADSLPRSFSNSGKWINSSSDYWTSGFVPGTLWYLYGSTKDQILKQDAIEKLKLLKKEENNTVSHDVGFMMYCSYGNAYHIDPNISYKNILLTSAKSLSTRFNKHVGSILSWNSAPGQFRVIIDNMMNLELLMWATKASGDSTYAKIAIAHANLNKQ